MKCARRQSSGGELFASGPDSEKAFFFEGLSLLIRRLSIHARNRSSKFSPTSSFEVCSRSCAMKTSAFDHIADAASAEALCTAAKSVPPAKAFSSDLRRSVILHEVRQSALDFLDPSVRLRSAAHEAGASPTDAAGLTDDAIVRHLSQVQASGRLLKSGAGQTTRVAAVGLLRGLCVREAEMALELVASGTEGDGAESSVRFEAARLRALTLLESSRDRSVLPDAVGAQQERAKELLRRAVAGGSRRAAVDLASLIFRGARPGGGIELSPAQQRGARAVALDVLRGSASGEALSFVDQTEALLAEVAMVVSSETHTDEVEPLLSAACRALQALARSDLTSAAASRHVAAFAAEIRFLKACLPLLRPGACAGDSDPVLMLTETSRSFQLLNRAANSGHRRAAFLRSLALLTVGARRSHGASWRKGVMSMGCALRMGHPKAAEVLTRVFAAASGEESAGAGSVSASPCSAPSLACPGTSASSPTRRGAGLLGRTKGVAGCKRRSSREPVLPRAEAPVPFGTPDKRRRVRAPAKEGGAARRLLARPAVQRILFSPPSP